MLSPKKYVACYSVPTDRRSFRTGPKKILEDRSVQDLKIAKRTSKDLFFDSENIIRFFKMASLEFQWQAYLIPLIPDYLISVFLMAPWDSDFLFKMKII